MAGMRVVVVACDEARQRRPRRPARARSRSTPTSSPRSWSPTRRRTACSRRRSARSAPPCTTPAARSTSTARTSTRWSGWPAGPVRRRRQSHLNLHKTFCIPHGGGGPGVGPVGGARAPRAVPAEPPAASRGGSGDRRRPDLGGAVGLGRHPADLVGLHAADGRRRADAGDRGRDPRRELRRRAAARRTTRCSTPARGGLVAHECILDLRPLTKATGVTVDDIAKRLIDYGFHAPTMRSRSPAR